MTPEEVYARKNTVLIVRTGSQLYGTVVSDKADTDEMGIFIEGRDSFFSVDPRYSRPTIISCRTAGKDEHGQDAKSTATDVDTTLFSLSHFMRETAKGNPNTITMLFAPGSAILSQTPRVINRELRRRREEFITQAMGDRFVGYLKNQRKLYLDNPNTKRPELIDQYGFDTKGAYHALRVGFQGTELMTTGNITLPVPERIGAYLRNVRTGFYSKADVEKHLEEIEENLKLSIMKSDWPLTPDYVQLTAWNERLHEIYWSYQQRLASQCY